MTQQRTATVKVGLLTMISLAVLITTVIWLRGRSLGGGQPYEVFFRDVDSLREGSSVQFMGVRVGFVDAVDPIVLHGSQYRVRVRFSISEPDVKIPRGSSISLEQSGIIGEKFVEITPPRPKAYDLVIPTAEPLVQSGLPIMVAFREGLVDAGRVVNVSESTVSKVFSTTPDHLYHLRYLLNLPGYMPPAKVEFQFVKNQAGQPYLVLEDSESVWMHRPSATTFFTLQEPMRLKEFLEEQLASAEALKTTNDKINQLLSDETIASIQGTVKNSEKLTAQATTTLKSANELFASTAGDLKVLVGSTQKLTDSVVAVSSNINDIAGNPQLKADVISTVKSVRESTAALSTLLNDPNLKQTLAETKVTTENAAQLMQYLKQSTVDNHLDARVDQSLNLLNSSLTRLSNIMGNVEAASNDKESIKAILEDTKATSANLKQFSERLNKRFLLFRLLF